MAGVFGACSSMPVWFFTISAIRRAILSLSGPGNGAKSSPGASVSEVGSNSTQPRCPK